MVWVGSGVFSEDKERFGDGCNTFPSSSSDSNNECESMFRCGLVDASLMCAETSNNGEELILCLSRFQCTLEIP